VARGRLRRAVALARFAEPRGRPTGRAITMDIALAAAATIAALLVAHRLTGGTLSTVPGPVPLDPVTHGAGWLAMLPAAAVRMAPLAIRRLRPLTTFWLCLAACVLVPFPGTSMVNFIALVPAAYSAVAYSRYRAAAMASVPAAVVVLAVPSLSPPVLSDNYTLLTALLVFIPVLVAGNAMRRWRSRAGDSQAQLVRLQAAHETATRRAIELERARIASELHDVVTHNVSVMIVQAGAARQVLATAPGEARAALLAVESSGRAAMSELRHLLGLLSPSSGEPGDAPPEDVPPGDPARGDIRSDAAGPGAGGMPAVPGLRPQPGLVQLQSLIDRVTAAGLPVELHVGDVPPGLPPGLDLAAFRVIQEALTNVIKHAGTPRTSVRLDYRGGDLVVEVADDGPPIPAATPGPACAGAGRGLLGLRERMALYGGELAAGPRPGGGWLVRARLPVDPQPAGEPGRSTSGLSAPGTSAPGADSHRPGAPAPGSPAPGSPGPALIAPAGLAPLAAQRR
jgi:signal transduction histidine kinase